MLGLKRGTVALCAHSEEWAAEAEKIIQCLSLIFGDYAVDIQHIGSTSIKNIQAKPIIDIVIGVKSFENLDSFLPPLAQCGIYKSSGQPFDDIVLFSRDNAENGERVNNIQAVIYGSKQWSGHIIFRDYMNSHPEKAAEYEKIKIHAAERFWDNGMSYSNCKNDFVRQCIEDAMKNA